MKAYKTTLFIYSVLGMMALLCWLWPADGVTLFGVGMRWPKLSEVMEVDRAFVTDSIAENPVIAEIEKLTPEELIEKEMEAAYQAKEEQFQEFCEVNPIRLFLPNDSAAYLDNFFRALDNAGAKHVRIIHYGDSQLEEDRITSMLRNNLQNKFGGLGVGLQPATKSTDKYTITQRTYPELPFNLLYGSSSFRASDRKYGPTLSVSHVHGKATVEMKPCKYTNYAHSRQFGHIGVLADGEGTIEVVTDDSTYLVVADTVANAQQFYIDLPAPVTELKYIFNGHWNVYGLMLDGNKGVTVDNISMRGYSGATFSQNDRTTMTPFFSNQNIGLIILQFGGNSVPGLKGEKNIASWKESIGKQIDYFHRLSPESCILLIGPADMSTSIQGQMQTYPLLPKVVQALKEAAQEHDAAFWSMYDAMGGWNSMLRWVAARPQLAGEDYIHFTHKGADKMADLLNEVIMSYYENYRLRNRLDPIIDECNQETGDSIAIVAEPDTTGTEQ